jgi:hypothetical protein
MPAFVEAVVDVLAKGNDPVILADRSEALITDVGVFNITRVGTVNTEQNQVADSGTGCQERTNDFADEASDRPKYAADRTAKGGV